MPKDVDVRIHEDSLRKLQLLSQVTKKSVADIVSTAVNLYGRMALPEPQATDYNFFYDDMSKSHVRREV